jgi:hypothetical protein
MFNVSAGDGGDVEKAPSDFGSYMQEKIDHLDQAAAKFSANSMAASAGSLTAGIISVGTTALSLFGGGPVAAAAAVASGAATLLLQSEAENQAAKVGPQRKEAELLRGIRDAGMREPSMRDLDRENAAAERLERTEARGWMVA